MIIEVSDKASEKIAEILLSANIRNPFLRVGVEEGGCSGLSYTLVVDEQQAEEDIVLNKRILVYWFTRIVFLILTVLKLTMKRVEW